MESHCTTEESEDNFKQLIASVKIPIREIFQFLSTEEHRWAIFIYLKGWGYGYFVVFL